MRDPVATADVLVENVRPGTLERWELGFAELSARCLTGEADRAPSRARISLGGSLAGTFAALGTVMAFGRLCEVMGRADLAAHEDYRTHVGRGRRQQELDDLVAGWTTTLDADDLLGRLHEAGVPAARRAQRRHLRRPARPGPGTA